MGSKTRARAAMPGDDLLFHRLSDSTIGAVGFHGRVRDGIGWVTDAMATKLWSQRRTVVLGCSRSMKAEPVIPHCGHALNPRLSLMVELSSANRAIRTG